MSKANVNMVLIWTILQQAGWEKELTFQKDYNKPVEPHQRNSDKFMQAVLQE